MKNNKMIVMVIVTVTVLIGMVFFTSSNLTSKINYVKGDGNIEEFRITEIAKSITEHIFASGSVRDEQSAAEIAATILKSVYGKDFGYGLPLIVNFDDVKQEWLIKTQLPKNMVGSVKYIIIKKSNAEVVAIWAIE